ncbi:hypothetical protein C0J52_07261 [Blattella germanica]|nr:hypothetical protein C0J52_07261 [Blattella germanica]
MSLRLTLKSPLRHKSTCAMSDYYATITVHCLGDPPRMLCLLSSEQVQNARSANTPDCSEGKTNE